jgi:hypothetical protein
VLIGVILIYEPGSTAESSEPPVGVAVYLRVKFPAVPIRTIALIVPFETFVVFAAIAVNVSDGNVVVPGRRTPDSAAALPTAVVLELYERYIKVSDGTAVPLGAPKARLCVAVAATVVDSI